MSNEGAGPIQEEVRQEMLAMGHVMEEALPKGWGFALLVFEIGDIDRGRMNYISNARREDMIVALKELIANFEGQALKPSEARQ